MAISSATAPGVIKFFGEHAVVYGKMSIGAAVNMHAYAELHQSLDKTGGFNILLKDYNEESPKLTKEDMLKLYKEYKTSTINEFLESNKNLGKALPYLTIGSRLVSEYNIDLMGKQIVLHSDIPIGKGLASSAACSVAVTTSIITYARLRIGDSEIIDIARDGERVTHANRNAGTIDVSTSYYGGYVSYSKEQGAKAEQINARLNLLLIDTGPKKSTAETVGNVARLYSKNKSYVEKIMSTIESYSIQGLNALRKMNAGLVGKYMLENHELLRKLGVSTEKLDNAVAIAVKNGAHGAKLSGGGGGGIAVAVSSKDKVSSIKDALENNGFHTHISEISLIGAKGSSRIGK